MKIHQRNGLEIASTIARIRGQEAFRCFATEFCQDAGDGTRPTAMHSENCDDIGHLLLIASSNKPGKYWYLKNYTAPIEQKKALQPLMSRLTPA